ncbi:MAG: hypothetical protein NTU49_04565 [Gammaproteobacteria bacterium]|nr:hypothetical protein [Gammaproteobacteria bacterium]
MIDTFYTPSLAVASIERLVDSLLGEECPEDKKALLAATDTHAKKFISAHKLH